MGRHPLPGGDGFEDFSVLYLNRDGRYVEPGDDARGSSAERVIESDELPEYLKGNIVLPGEVTDVFVWVHGWRTDAEAAVANARRLFNGIMASQRARPGAYPGLDEFRPGFVAVHWPSMSPPGLFGYKKIRNRAKALTERGEAEFFLAALLGYLEEENQRAGPAGSKVLRAAGGFYVHCLGHSFGGRFLTAAIRAAADPRSPRTLSLLEETGRGARKLLSGAADRFHFTVDSVLIFQMAAPRVRFGPELKLLIDEAPLRGPVVLTHSSADLANCVWHRVGEWGQPAIGCSGAAEPRGEIGRIELGELEYRYVETDFQTPIVNVDASWAYTGSALQAEGAHGDFWYEESIHLILSLANFVRQ